MAFLNLKKNKAPKKEEAPEAKKKAGKSESKIKQTKKISVAGSARITPNGLVLGPRITEKGAMMSELNVYTFNVNRKANKKDVAREIHLLYKVRPAKVRILNIPGKKVFMKGKMGSTSGGRKAYVTLQKGDKIEFV